MKRFRFPLERVLRQRGLQEDLAEQALARAVIEERVAGEELARVRQQITDESALMCSALAAHLAGADLALHVRFAAALHGRQTALRGRRAAAAAALGKCRDTLRERRRAREAVEQLKKAAWQRYCETSTREEHLLMDEIAGSRHERLRVEAED